MATKPPTRWSKQSVSTFTTAQFMLGYSIGPLVSPRPEKLEINNLDDNLESNTTYNVGSPSCVSWFMTPINYSYNCHKPCDWQNLNHKSPCLMIKSPCFIIFPYVSWVYLYVSFLVVTSWPSPWPSVSKLAVVVSCPTSHSGMSLKTCTAGKLRNLLLKTVEVYNWQLMQVIAQLQDLQVTTSIIGHLQDNEK